LAPQSSPGPGFSVGPRTTVPSAGDLGVIGDVRVGSAARRMVSRKACGSTDVIRGLAKDRATGRFRSARRPTGPGRRGDAAPRRSPPRRHQHEGERREQVETKPEGERLKLGQPTIDQHDDTAGGKRAEKGRRLKMISQLRGDGTPRLRREGQGEAPAADSVTIDEHGQARS